MSTKQEAKFPPPDPSSRTPEYDLTYEQLWIHGDVQSGLARRAIGEVAFYKTIAEKRGRENKRLTQDNEQLSYEATHDDLTGLLNRAGVFEMLEKNYQKNPNGLRRLSFLDANGLKEVNDTLSHSFGDDYLRAIANGISAVTRTSRDGNNDDCGRLSGGEFALFGEVDYEIDSEGHNEIITSYEDEVRESVRVHTQAFIRSYLKEHQPRGEVKDEIRELLNNMLDEDFEFIAIGTVIYAGNDHDSAINISDHRMYEDKNKTQADQEHDLSDKFRKTER